MSRSVQGLDFLRGHIKTVQVLDKLFRDGGQITIALGMSINTTKKVVTKTHFSWIAPLPRSNILLLAASHVAASSSPPVLGENIRVGTATTVSKDASASKRRFFERLCDGEDGDIRRFFFAPFSYSGGIQDPLADAANGCTGGDPRDDSPPKSPFWIESSMSGPGDDAGEESLHAVGEDGGDEDGAETQRVSCTLNMEESKCLPDSDDIRRRHHGHLIINIPRDASPPSA